MGLSDDDVLRMSAAGEWMFIFRWWHLKDDGQLPVA